MIDGRRGTLVGIETAGIQSYIFRSNRLRENVGASYLVSQSTDQWVHDAVRSINRNGAAPAEVLYAGGGNSVIWFSTSELAVEFTRELSQHTLIAAPGLHITITHLDLNTDSALSVAVQQILRALKPARSMVPRYGALAGLGVTAACQSTGLAATAYREVADGEQRYVSSEVSAKLDAFPQADRLLEHTLQLNPGFTYPYDLDKLGRDKDESSYIAVVHADGNGIGNIIRRIGEAFPTTDLNNHYLDTIRAFSDGLKQMTERAMQRLLDLLTLAVRYDPNLDADIIQATDRQPRIVLDRNQSGKIILPFRPLVSGGDDVTFLCDGRIGLSLAVAFLRFFELESAAFISELKPRLPKLQQAAVPTALTACAGIAIVKSHYPFSRAYELAEDLCSSAKKFKRREQLSGSALDWHYTPGGLYDNIDAMRKRDYSIENVESESQQRIRWNLALRPVSLEGEHLIRNWPTIEYSLSEFQYKWTSKRNKAKALRDALRGGQASVSLFIRRYEQALPEVQGFTDGWYLDSPAPDQNPDNPVHHFCAYDDALELMDLYIPLSLEQIR